ncbi:B-cell receptor CD22-like isoform X2 [Alosa pseudoharengus]
MSVCGPLFVAFLLSAPGVLGNTYGVEYSLTEICAPAGSAVDIPCTYTYPTKDTVKKAFWFTKWEEGKDPEDLFQSEDYRDRAEYRGNKEHDCTLRIKNLRDTDHGLKYRFRFITDDPVGKYAGKEVTLYMTGPLKVDKRELNLRVTLTCTSTCPLNSRPTYIWYRNRQPVGAKYRTSGNTLVINPVSNDDSGHYSCALRGHEDHPSPPVCVSHCWSVTYTHQEICAVEGSSVDITCYYSYPSGYAVTTPLWFSSLGSGERMDFSVKNTYDNHVEYIGNKNNDCSLRIKELSLNHKGKYHFRFETNDTTGRWNGKTDVSLSVAGPLKVNKNRENRRVTLTCTSTCPPNSRPTYIWYRNRQPVGAKYTTSGNTLVINPVSNDDSGHYSCAVRGHEDHPSPPVCVFSCSSVTYTHQEICVVEGSCVDITCYYSYPSGYAVTTPLWFSSLGSGERMDFSVKNTYRNHVEYLGNKMNDCSLRIKELSVKHTGQYYFRFSTNKDDEEFSGKPVSLSVTGLLVNMDPDIVKEGESATLICSTTCTLSDPPSYIWYKNSHPIADSQTSMEYLYLNPVRIDDSGSYSCTVRGYEDHPSPVRTLSVMYTPRNMSASPSFSGHILEGSSVTLTCSSDANPPATYTWFKVKRGQTFSMGSGQQLNISNISSEFSGQFYCRAENSAGTSDSEPFLVDVHYGPKNTSASITPSGDIVEGDSVTLTCSSDANPPVHNYTWYKINRVNTSLGSEQNLSFTNISTGDMGQYYCEVANTVASSYSAGLHVNVYYSPRNTSVMVSSSGEGSLVTLTCNTDSNPPVHTYSWYRKNSSGSVLTATGNNSSFTGVSDGDIYYCVAHNEYGSHNSSEIEVTSAAIIHQTGMPAGLFAALGIIPAVAIIVVLVFVCRRGKGISTTENRSTMVGNRQPEDPSPVYEHVSAVLLTSDHEDRVDSQGDQVVSGGDQEVSGGDQEDLGGDQEVSGGDQEDSGGDQEDLGGDKIDSGGDQEDSGGDRVVLGGDQVISGGDENDVQYATVQFKVKNKDVAQDSPAVQPQEKKEEEEDVTYASVKFRSPSREVIQ